MDFDAILPANFAGQVLTDLIASNAGFAILDRWFRYQSINQALAFCEYFHRNDLGREHHISSAGEVAPTVEPSWRSIPPFRARMWLANVTCNCSRAWRLGGHVRPPLDSATVKTGPVLKRSQLMFRLRSSATSCATASALPP